MSSKFWRVRLEGISITLCRCGHRNVPAQRLGCERCGAYGDALSSTTIVARGRVIDRAQNAGDDTWVADMALDDGETIRAWLATPAPAPGEVAEGRWIDARLTFGCAG